MICQDLPIVSRNIFRATALLCFSSLLEKISVTDPSLLFFFKKVIKSFL